MTLQILIFDFDGTLAKSLDTIVAITNRLALEFGYSPISPEQLHEFRHLSSQDIIQRSGVAWYKLPFLIRRLRRELNNEIHRLELVTGIQEILILLKEKGYRLGIITSNAQENVKLCLEYHQLDCLFEFIESEFNIFGKSRAIRRVIYKYQFLPSEVVYVGDEVRDIEAAQKIPIKVMAVAWGFQSKEILAQFHPEFLIEEPQELLAALEGGTAKNCIQDRDRLNC